ncbi:MAG: hypothetical protein WBK20_09020 [Spirochaetota bacterium]
MIFLVYILLVLCLFRFTFELLPENGKLFIINFVMFCTSLCTEYLGLLLIGKRIDSICIDFLDESSRKNKDEEYYKATANTYLCEMACDSDSVEELQRLINRIHEISKSIDKHKFRKLRASVCVYFVKYMNKQ